MANIIQRETLGPIKVLITSYLWVIIVNTGMLIHGKWYWLYVSGLDPEGLFEGGVQALKDGPKRGPRDPGVKINVGGSFGGRLCS